MTISRGDRYYCSARREKGTCDVDRGIGAHELEQRVLNGLRDILLGNEVLIDEFATEFKQELARLRKERHITGRRLLRDLQQVERGIKRCLDFITGGDGDPGSVRDQLRQLETRKREIAADLGGERPTSRTFRTSSSASRMSQNDPEPTFPSPQLSGYTNIIPPARKGGER